MEIYGYIPIQPQFIPNNTIIRDNKLYVSGSVIPSNDPNVSDKANLSVIAKCIISSRMPSVDGVTSVPDITIKITYEGERFTQKVININATLTLEDGEQFTLSSAIPTVR